MKRTLRAGLAICGLLIAGISLPTPAQALTYVGDWRMTVHQDSGEECTQTSEGEQCAVTFDIRTNQPGWEGSDQYEVYVKLDGVDLYGDAGQTEYATVDPEFSGVRAMASTTALSRGAHTLVLDWYYYGVWTCSPSLPTGCAWVGREHVRKTYKFRWSGTDKVVRPFHLPGSKASATAKRTGTKVRLSTVAKAQKLTSDFVPTRTYSPIRGTKVTLQSYSPGKHRWVPRARVRTNSKGVASVQVKAPSRTKWR
ncbi:hypothetical protein ACLM5J_16640 [Nocardioides sp. Bht2]|uniref:hypothetical protein n=1 Tax=Nocardioides sp. Bht2 TaxID=3392297 RepID=UPI0039B3F79D